MIAKIDKAVRGDASCNTTYRGAKYAAIFIEKSNFLLSTLVIPFNLYEFIDFSFQYPIEIDKKV